MMMIYRKFHKIAAVTNAEYNSFENCDATTDVTNPKPYISYHTVVTHFCNPRHIKKCDISYESLLSNQSNENPYLPTSFS